MTLETAISTQDPKGRLESRAYFCTDLSVSVEEILINYARSWTLEIAFRNAKQAMGLQDPQNGWWRRKQGTRRPKKRPGPHPRQNRGRKAARRTVPFAFVAYALVVVWSGVFNRRATQPGPARASDLDKNFLRVALVSWPRNPSAKSASNRRPWQGARRAHTGRIQPTSNAGRGGEGRRLIGRISDPGH